MLMLILSLITALIPLAGIAWILAYGSITSVDGLFLALILLALSGILFLNAFLNLRKKIAPPSSAGSLPSRRTP
jgi:hypothetical protein